MLCQLYLNFLKRKSINISEKSEEVSEYINKKDITTDRNFLGHHILQ